LNRPWLDVLYYAEAADEIAADEREHGAMLAALATWAPERLRERAEARERAADTRTADEIWRGVVDAERRGWRQ